MKTVDHLVNLTGHRFGIKVNEAIRGRAREALETAHAPVTHVFGLGSLERLQRPARAKAARDRAVRIGDVGDHLELRPTTCIEDRPKFVGVAAHRGRRSEVAAGNGEEFHAGGHGQEDGAVEHVAECRHSSGAGSRLAEKEHRRSVRAADVVAVVGLIAQDDDRVGRCDVGVILEAEGRDHRDEIVHERADRGPRDTCHDEQATVMEQRRARKPATKNHPAMEA